MSNFTYITPANLGYFKTKLYEIFADKALVDTLIGSDTGKSVRAIAAEELAAKLIPENANDALNTLAEIAAWIQDHPADAAAMNEAISALQTAVTNLQNGLGALASKDTVAEADLDASLKAKVNAAAEGNHSHDNKTVLDGITAAKVSDWDSKAAGNHSHTPAEIGAAPATHSHDYAASGHSHAYADLTGKPTIPTTVAQLSDAVDYAKKTDIPTFTEATEDQIDALFA